MGRKEVLLWEKQMERDNWEYLGIGWRIILKWILQI
jgi:hypothetical protein